MSLDAVATVRYHKRSSFRGIPMTEQKRKRRPPPIRSAQQAEEAVAPTASRSHAGLLYAHDMKERSLAQLHEEEPALAAVSIRTLERWSAADDWASARQQFWQELRKTTANRNAVLLSDFLQDQVTDLIAVYETSKRILESGVLQPKSYEALVKTMIELAKRIDEIGERVPHKRTGPAEGKPPVPPLDPESAQRLAHLMLRYERAVENGRTINIVEVDPAAVS